MYYVNRGIGKDNLGWMDASFFEVKTVDELVRNLSVFAVLYALSAYAKILKW